MNPTTTAPVDYDELRRQHDDARYKRLVLAAQLADAELSVLDLYDNERRGLGHDFGNGQRFAELARKRRARDAAIAEAHAYGYGMGTGDLSGTRTQCLAAYRRISGRRLRRYEREAHVTATHERAREAWQRVAVALCAMDETG